MALIANCVRRPHTDTRFWLPATSGQPETATDTMTLRPRNGSFARTQNELANDTQDNLLPGEQSWRAEQQLVVQAAELDCNRTEFKCAHTRKVARAIFNLDAVGRTAPKSSLPANGCRTCRSSAIVRRRHSIDRSSAAKGRKTNRLESSRSAKELSRERERDLSSAEIWRRNKTSRALCSRRALR